MIKTIFIYFYFFTNSWKGKLNDEICKQVNAELKYILKEIGGGGGVISLKERTLYYLKI